MTKQTFRLGALVIMVASIALTGCSAQRKIEGTWTGTETVSRGGFSTTVDSTYLFNHDNTLSIKQHIPLGPMGVDVNETGTYKVDGQSIDCTITNGTISSSGFRPGSAQPATRTVPVNLTIDYTWSLKDSKTLDLKISSATGAQSKSVQVGKTYELTKQS